MTLLEKKCTHCDQDLYPIHGQDLEGIWCALCGVLVYPRPTAEESEQEHIMRAIRDLS